MMDNSTLHKCSTRKKKKNNIKRGDAIGEENKTKARKYIISRLLFFYLLLGLGFICCRMEKKNSDSSGPSSGKSVQCMAFLTLD